LPLTSLGMWSDDELILKSALQIEQFWGKYCGVQSDGQVLRRPTLGECITVCLNILIGSDHTFAKEPFVIICIYASELVFPQL